MLVELEFTAQSFELFLGQLFMGLLGAARLLLGTLFRHCDDPYLLDSSFVSWQVPARKQRPEVMASCSGWVCLSLVFRGQDCDVQLFALVRSSWATT